MSDNNPELRCSDADREKVVAELREHYASGRLTLEEFDERSDTAYEAKTFGDLAKLTTDLPAAALEPKPASRPAKRPNSALRGAWASWLSVSLVCTVIWLLSVVSNGQLDYFWPMWVIGPWGVIVLTSTIGGRYSQRRDDDAKRLTHDERADRRLEQHQRHTQMRMDRMDQRRRRHGELG